MTQNFNDVHDDQKVAEALAIVRRRMAGIGGRMGCADNAKSLFILMLGLEKVEVFAAAFLDNQGRLLGAKELHRGTTNEVKAYPRELAREALRMNADSVVIAHNHPYSNLTASDADLELTKSCRKALMTIDIILTDHILVSNGAAVSFLEEGWI